ncbi:MAG: hypothetical protein COZ37_04310 [bacterium (Candidatus Ratteibacteria) CG_4_10_14_3_um_filter_41_18]|uniref:Trk system potassium uptake protein TrkA n=4 Tax=Candidatus Ratteibacteria TaxID=2979319 RepID=A0A2M7YHG9_9BACT|nr:MAG: hypothetical protein AUJ76_00255 [Candidatus Omnitrophica bacterium CG1_02_41_171]PIV63695.1 MAG: hypothetical protein COS11_06090 [bacterium (Candidatus Ratteibacteria) CG01_land_8_20_14_3_00_40_19]PIW33740.1 MAG: hypothetical protein COW28_02980 [bacterium (Candidatus Ratteibacteria) CG15_BIG_FIL_POST_REV_8_21_14_020_41_12]PIW74254.1 MAG: hypothetical protein CO004_01630 [bacterium (Candidatus Ratteibacteria) CG_4_8_14_3_um_filter_41_36]PIX77132.1 MAG: hypothetical protein COZ37_04310
MYIIVVGGGKIGYYLAKKLHQDNHTVSLIEKDREICRMITNELDILVINGDWCSLSSLEAAGAERADVVAAVTGSDEDNLVICQLAKEKFHLSRTVGMVNDPKNEYSFNELGVDVAVNSTGIIAKIIEEEVSLDDFVNLATFKKGKLALIRIDLPDDSPVIGKEIKNLNLPADSILLSVIRGSQVLIPRSDTILQLQDEVVALTSIEKEQDLLHALLGAH